MFKPTDLKFLEQIYLGDVIKIDIIFGGEFKST
jgi:hypothetical protein